jgi:hypothetical protein
MILAVLKYINLIKNIPARRLVEVGMSRVLPRETARLLAVPKLLEVFNRALKSNYNHSEPVFLNELIFCKLKVGFLKV